MYPCQIILNVTVAAFYKWYGAQKSLVERLPGYVDGMLTKRPNYEEMSSREQRNVKDIYINIHGWLNKAGSMYSKVNVRTKHIPMYPYPDIAQWWKDVNDIYALSEKEIDRRKAYLHGHYQYEDELCVPYYSRFEAKVTELKLLGTTLADTKMGVI